MRARGRGRGYILAYLLLVLSALTVVILTGAAFRASRLRSAHQGYLEAAALSLAQGGVEAAAAELSSGRRPSEHPLGEDEVALSAARGSLTVETTRSGGVLVVISCATVTPARPHLVEVRRCVEAAFDGDDRIAGWSER